jgi:hypothetical protein
MQIQNNYGGCDRREVTCTNLKITLSCGGGSCSIPTKNVSHYYGVRHSNFGQVSLSIINLNFEQMRAYR